MKTEELFLFLILLLGLILCSFLGGNSYFESFKQNTNSSTNSGTSSNSNTSSSESRSDSSVLPTKIKKNTALGTNEVVHLSQSVSNLSSYEI